MEPDKTENIDRKDTASAVIAIKGLAKSFEGIPILHDIELDLKKGETVVDLGKSGTVKSVLLKCIVGLITPDEGSVTVLGNEIPRLSYNELQKIREKIGYIFQNGALYDSMTVRENLEFPLVRHFSLNEKETDDKIKEVLESVDLEGVEDKMPSELSGGMRKRIGVARTLILKPEIMLWDEPTTGLDPATDHGIGELIVKMQKDFNVSSLVVTHDIPCAKLAADRVAVLKEGKFAALGTFDDLKKSKDEFVNTFFKYNII